MWADMFSNFCDRFPEVELHFKQFNFIPESFALYVCKQMLNHNFWIMFSNQQQKTTNVCYNTVENDLNLKCPGPYKL